MRIDVKYAANVQPGDLFAGSVNPHAPTRPCQPCASAMRVQSVEEIPDPESPKLKLYRFRFDGLAGLPSHAYSVTDQVLIIDGA